MPIQVLIINLLAISSFVISCLFLIKKTNLFNIYSLYLNFKKTEQYEFLILTFFAIMFPFILFYLGSYLSNIQKENNNITDFISPITSFFTAFILYQTYKKQQEDTKIKTIIDSLDKYEKIIENLQYNKPNFIIEKNSDEGINHTGKEALDYILENLQESNKKKSYQTIREDNAITINQIIGYLYSTLLYILELEGKSKERYLTILRNYLSFEEQSLIFF